MDTFDFTLPKFLLLKLFELEIPALKASKELKLSYMTVHKFYEILRERIHKEICEQESIYKQYRRVLELCKGEANEVPWGFGEDIPALHKGA